MKQPSIRAGLHNEKSPRVTEPANFDERKIEDFRRAVFYLRIITIFMLFATSIFGSMAVWDSDHTSPNYAEGIVCALETQAGKSYRYSLNDFDNASNATIPGLEGIILRIYLSNDIEHFVTLTPALFTTLAFSTFILMSAAFFAYDCLVMHQHYSIMTETARLSKVVESMFPVVVRDRFLKGVDVPQSRRRSSMDLVKSIVKTPSFRLRTSMDLIKSFVQTPSFHETSNNLSLTTRTDPIAVMFPKTTIMFADIAGFTAWSSLRHPKEVFHLLESLFMQFDAVAKKLKVFKVETIGDCYVAVAGLPDPQENHAVIMAQFALECQKKMEKVKVDLGGPYGLGTEVLKLRIGLHSGPVTAGVLRSEKSRFQLFGDTMNTASRMESTGEATKVQISEQTAELLEAAGKSSWFIARECLVSVKGKGTMKTYWLCPYGHSRDTIEHKVEVDASMKNDMDSSVHISEEVYNFHTKHTITEALPKLNNNFVDVSKGAFYKRSNSLPVTSNENDGVHYQSFIKIKPNHRKSYRTPAA